MGIWPILRLVSVDYAGRESKNFNYGNAMAMSELLQDNHSGYRGEERCRVRWVSLTYAATCDEGYEVPSFC
jgi:hypothetical protein